MSRPVHWTLVRLTLLPQTPVAWMTVKVGCVTIAAWWLLFGVSSSDYANSLLAGAMVVPVAALTFPIMWGALFVVTLDVAQPALGAIPPEVTLVLMPLTAGLAQYANCYLWARVVLWKRKPRTAAPAPAVADGPPDAGG